MVFLHQSAPLWPRHPDRHICSAPEAGQGVYLGEIEETRLVRVRPNSHVGCPGALSAVMGRQSIPMELSGRSGTVDHWSGITWGVHLCRGQGGCSTVGAHAHIQNFHMFGRLCHHVFQWCRVLFDTVLPSDILPGRPRRHRNSIGSVDAAAYLGSNRCIFHHWVCPEQDWRVSLLARLDTTGAFTDFAQSYWYNLVVGFSIWTISVGLLSTIDVNTSMAKLIGFQLLCGIGAGQTFQTSLVAIQASVKREDMATATGIRNFLRMLGGTLGLAICSVLVNNIVRSHLTGQGLSDGLIDSILNSPTVTSSLSGAQKAAVLEAYGKSFLFKIPWAKLMLKTLARGIRACFYFMIPCTAISVLLIVFFVKRVSLRRDDDAQRKAEGKAWIAARDARRRAKKHPHEEEEKHIEGDHAHSSSSDLDDLPAGSDLEHDTKEAEHSDGKQSESGLQKVLSSLKNGAEVSGGEEGEAAGAQPPKDEVAPVTRKA